MGWDSPVLVVEEKTKAVILSKHKETDFLSGLQNRSELTGEECSVDSFYTKQKRKNCHSNPSVPNLLFSGSLLWLYRP